MAMLLCRRSWGGLSPYLSYWLVLHQLPYCSSFLCVSWNRPHKKSRLICCYLHYKKDRKSLKPEFFVFRLSTCSQNVAVLLNKSKNSKKNSDNSGSRIVAIYCFKDKNQPMSRGWCWVTLLQSSKWWTSSNKNSRSWPKLFSLWWRRTITLFQKRYLSNSLWVRMRWKNFWITRRKEIWAIKRGRTSWW